MKNMPPHSILKISEGVATCAIGLLVVLASAAAFAEGVAKQLSGQVEVGRGEPPVWAALRAGEKIDSLDRVRTGADGRVEITMAAGTVRVHENSMLRLPPAEGNADRVQLDAGHSLFDVLKRAGRRFEVHTPTVVVSVKGTQFGVDARGEVGQVAVYRGLVGVREFGAAASVETLVREGFLAVGGPGMPIELEVAPEMDAWASWQDFSRPAPGLRDMPARRDDLSRAKEALRRSTDGDVIRRAAERKPEVAKRVKAMRSKEMKRRKSDAMRVDRVMPAAPMNPDDDDSSKADRTRRRMLRDMMQGDEDSMLDQDMKEQMAKKRRMTMQAERINDALEGMQETINVEEMMGGSSFSSGGEGFDFEELDDLDPQTMLVVMNAFQIVQNQFEGQGSTGWTPDDVVNNLRSALVSLGLDATDASRLIQDLIDD